MILKSRNKKPSISFGLGKFTAEIEVGQSVRVYLTMPYLDAAYNIYLNGAATNTQLKISSNEWKLTSTVAGTYNIHILIVDKLATINKKSNVITLIVS